MPAGLKRFQETGDLHFVTFGCYGRKLYLVDDAAKETFESCLETMHQRYQFPMAGYVVMPDHVHLLVGEPPEVGLSLVLQALKISVSKRLPGKPFWERRYYDFNVYSFHKQAEKLQYMHRNPVAQGLAQTEADWKWSSYRYYAKSESGTVQITPRYL
jgi:putative transposase